MLVRGQMGIHVGYAMLPVPVELAMDGVLEADARFPAEGALRRRGVQHHGRHIVRSGRHDRNGLRQGDLQVIRHLIEYFLDGMPVAGGHVENTASRIALNDQIHQRNEVRHVEKITHRIAAKALLPGLQALVERGDRTYRQARPGNVRKPKRHDRNL